MPHPRTRFFSSLTCPRQSASSLGYRMPAEWEPMRRVWLVPPHNAETWPGCLGKAQKQFRVFMKELRRFVEIGTAQNLRIPVNDSWVRDFGPIFVVTDRAGLPRKALHDFRFNGWGGKYEVRDLDDMVPQYVARYLKLPLWVHDTVLEGGSIDVNGAGSVMTTEQCLLNKNRNPRKSRNQIVKELHEALGTRHVIWLPGGIVGDDTDGHIDDIARFVSPTTVVSIHAPKKSHPDHDTLKKNRQALRNARDQDGRKLTVVELPVPDPILYKFPPDRFGPGGVNPVPASYANFLIANGGVFLPVFGQKSDDLAVRVLEQVMPDHRIVPIRCEFLVVGLGALHCLSQQEPE